MARPLLAKKAAVGIWLDAGVLLDRSRLVPAFVASNVRQLGASFGSISRTTFYEDCLAGKSPAERAFRSELSNAGIDVLHQPWSGAADAAPLNAALREDLMDFVEQKRPGRRTVIVATTNANLSPTLKTIADESKMTTIVIGPESVRPAYPSPIVFAPLGNLLQLSASSVSATGGRPSLDLEELLGAGMASLPPQQAKFDLGEFFPGGKDKTKIKGTVTKAEEKRSKAVGKEILSQSASPFKVAAEPTVKVAAEPTVKAVLMPAVKAVPKPAVAVPKPAVKAVSKSAVKAVPKPAVKAVSKPAVAVPKPAVKVVSKSVAAFETKKAVKLSAILPKTKANDAARAAAKKAKRATAAKKG